MTGMEFIFILIGVSVTVTKFLDFVEYIGGGNAHGKRQYRSSAR